MSKETNFSAPKCLISPPGAVPSGFSAGGGALRIVRRSARKGRDQRARSSRMRDRGTVAAGHFLRGGMRWVFTKSDWNEKPRMTYGIAELLAKTAGTTCDAA